jgi:GT2 family glycosyltransferase
VAPRSPTVTVVVLNYNGVHHLETCFTSLSRLDYPPDRLEVMLVDNGSTDGSVAYVEDQFPNIRVLAIGENLGFAAGNNRGASQARGDHVVFLNNDMHVDPGFLVGLEEAMQSDREAVSAAAKILNWDGTKYDFAGATSNFAAYGGQVGYGQEYDPGRFTEIEPVLFACGGAMLVDRRVFLEAGGFDESYFAFYEDVDLGWRLWLLGHKVLFAPNALAFHRHHGTIGSTPAFRKELLYRRNSLLTVIKNYDDRNLGRVLPATLLALAAGVVDSAVRAGKLDLASFASPNLVPPDDAPLVLDKRTASTLVALHEIAHDLPSLFDKREQIQARRRRSDEELAVLLQPFVPMIPATSPDVVSAAVDGFGVLDIFANAPRRVLVVSPDILPFAGLPTVGSALRAWGIAEGLRSKGHDVRMTMPREAVERFPGRVPPEAERTAWDAGNLFEQVLAALPDVVVICGWPPAAFLYQHPGVPVVLDQAGPHLIEREFAEFGDPAENAEQKLAALSIADYFTCSGARQFEYFSRWLERAGWSERDIRERAASIPFSIDPRLPERQDSDELTFVYGGIFLPWQDPSRALKVVVEELERRDRGKLQLLGGKHPWGRIDTGVFDDLYAQLGQSDRVAVSEFLPYDELGSIYSRAHVAVDLMLRNRERELAFSTRTVVYLWYGLPVIHSDYSELSEYIREYDAGWTVDPEDEAALRAVLEDIFENPGCTAVKGRNAQRLVQEQLTWDRTIEPLDGFVRRPSIRARAATSAYRTFAPPTLLDKIRRTFRAQGVPGLTRKAARVAKQRLTRPG